MALPDIDQLNERIWRYSSAERLTLLRNLGYGGAAASLAVLAGLTQVGAKDSALQVSVFAASVSLPAWLLIGSIYEYYIFLGKQSYGHLRTRFLIALSSGLLLVAGLGMLATTGGIIWFLIPEAAYAFGVSVLLAVVLGIVFQWHLAGWWSSHVDAKSGTASKGGDGV